MYSGTSNWARRWLFLLLHLEPIDYESQVIEPFIILSHLKSRVFHFFLVPKLRLLIVISLHIVVKPDNLLVLC